MTSKATQKYTAIYKNSVKKHDAEPVYARPTIAPQNGNLVSAPNTQKYSASTQKYINQFGDQKVQRVDMEAAQARARKDALNIMMTQNQMRMLPGGAPSIGPRIQRPEPAEPTPTLAPEIAGRLQREEREKQNRWVEQAAQFSNQRIQNASDGLVRDEDGVVHPVPVIEAEPNVMPGIDEWRRIANREAMERSIEQRRAAAEENPALGALQSTFGGAIGGAFTPVGIAAQRALGHGEEIDINAPVFRMTRNAQAAREGTQTGVKNVLGISDYDENGNRTLASQVSDFGVGVGLSMMETIMRSAFLGPTAGGIEAGLSAGSQGFIEAKQKGFDDFHAVATGVAQGIAEEFFEKYSLGELQALKNKPVDSMVAFIKNMGRQAIAEGSEEFFTDWANAVSDWGINGGESEWANTYNYYLSQGDNENQAIFHTLRDTFYQSMQSALAGAVSGGFLGAGAQVAYGRANSQRGQDLLQSGEQLTAQDLRETAEAIDENYSEQAKSTREYLLGLAKKAESGQTLTPAEQGAALNELSLMTGDNYEVESEAETARREMDEETARNLADTFGEEGKKVFSEIAPEDAVDAYRSFAEAYNYGRWGGKEPSLAGISSDLKSAALRAGAADANALYPVEAVTNVQNALKKAKVKGVKAGKADLSGINYQNLTAQQKLRVDWSSNFITKAVGIDVRYIQSEARNGEYSGANGAFSVIDGRPTITLDVNAGMMSESDWTGEISDIKTMLPVVSHELTHFLEKYAPAQYKELSQGVIRALSGSSYTQNGAVDINQAIRAEMARLDATEASLRGEGYKHTEAEAIHEMVARACEDFMAGDKRAVEAFSKLDADTKKTIADHIKGVFQSIREFFEQLISGYRSSSTEAKALRQNQAEFDRLEKVWLDALGVARKSAAALSEVSKNATAEDVNNSTQYSVEFPYRFGSEAASEWLNALPENARKTADMFAALHDIGLHNKAQVMVGVGAARHGKVIDVTTRNMLASEWNGYVDSSKSFAKTAKMLADALPENVRRAAHIEADGHITPSEFENQFKMMRSFMQRVVDALPDTLENSTTTVDGKEVKLSDKNKIYMVGGEAYRKALLEERRRLYDRGILGTKSISGLSKDTWGTMGFLAANTKTTASGDFTTFCPQMYYNKGCWYCYRLSALRSGINNKLVGENVWYTGEILRLKQEDINSLNKAGGLRIQSFGDWMEKYTSQLLDMLYDAEKVGLQIKVITKEPSMIDTVARLKEQGFGKNLYFNLSSDYTIEEAPFGAIINPERPFMRKDGRLFWKRALTVEEANEYRQKYPWVNTRIVATNMDEFIRGLESPYVDVVTGYHGRDFAKSGFERVSSETGETLVEVEALGDPGMPRFSYNPKTQAWSREFEGKTNLAKRLADEIESRGLQYQYYIKTCCQTGRCASCEGKCGALAKDFNIKNATNRDAESVKYWQKEMTADPASYRFAHLLTNEEFRDMQDEFTVPASQNDLNSDMNPVYTGTYGRETQFQHRVTQTETLPDGRNVLNFLNDQIERGEYTETYKAFLKIGDTYYSPMATLEKDANGKYTKLRNGIKLEQWLASDGILTDEMRSRMKMKSPAAWKKQYASELSNGTNPWGMYGDFKLKKADSSGKAIGDVEAAYNPYQHSSDSVLNDQFQSAYARPDIVVVRCCIPNSEINTPYWAPYAKDPTGMHNWKTGPIAEQLKKTTRHVYMSRWIYPVEELTPSEVAQKIYETISKETVQPRMYWNTLNPAVAEELEKLGVAIDPYGSPNYLKDDGGAKYDRYGKQIPQEVLDNRRKKKAAKKVAKANDTQYSARDNQYMSAVDSGNMEEAQRLVDEAAERTFSDSKIRDEDGKLLKVYHGSDADFTVFDRSKGRSTMDIQGSFFSPWDIEAGGYGPNVRAFYLDIKNPAPESVAYRALNAFKGQNNAGVKARERLERMGYDGVNNSGEEYIAFHPEQIKSADPVTYDNGNAIPLSERFNPENPDIRFSARDSSGRPLSAGQQSFFADSKARDDEGNLLVLYHGTSNAGFNEFWTNRGVWLTTSRMDANSYGGNWEDRIYDPDEREERRQVTSGDFRIGSTMRFDTEADRDEFLRRFPDADNYMTVREEDARQGELDAQWDADNYDELQEAFDAQVRRDREIRRGYQEYNWRHGQLISVQDLADNYERYSLDDLKSVWMELEPNGYYFDDEFDSDSDEEYRDELGERLRSYIAEEERSIPWDEYEVSVRIPAGETGEIVNTPNHRSYELYANVKNPYVFDNHGRGSEGNGTFYRSIERAMADPQYDGVIAKNARVGAFQKLGTVVLVKDPNQVKLTSNVNPTESDDIRYSARDYAPTFYSKLQREVQNYKGDKIGASSVESYLKSRGVKDEEIKWSGIRQYLEGKKSVSKKELAEYLEENEFKIEIKNLGDSANSNLWANDISDVDITHYYATTESGIAGIMEFESPDDFRTAAITAAEMDGLDPADIIFDIDTEHGYLSAEIPNADWILEAQTPDTYDLEDAGFRPVGESRWGDYKLDGGTNYRELLFVDPKSSYSNQAMSTHWGERNPGVLAHARVQDFDTESGEKVLFIEEIQSDWHNAGQKSGYISSVKNAKTELRDEGYWHQLYVNGEPTGMGTTPAQVRAEGADAVIEDLFKTYQDSKTLADKREGKAPDAPFRTTYTDYALKNLLRMAAEGDYDYLAWTTGKMQEERWSDAYAEGYRIEYDQDIPKFLKKYGKQWGADLTTVQLEGDGSDSYIRTLETQLADARGRGNARLVADLEGKLNQARGYVVPAIVVNDAMKQSVLYEGQPMFSQRHVDIDQRIADAVAKYGALPKGEKPARVVDIPKKNDNGRSTRRYARTVLESGITTDDMDDRIKEAILSDALSYEPVSDKAAAEYAASVIRIGGTARAQKEWDRATNTKAISSTGITKYDMAVGQELLREYAKQGDTDAVLKMVIELSAEGTRAGQTIQAMRLLKKYATQTPAIGLGYIQRTVDQMNRDAKAKMGKKYKEMKIDPALAAEYINATTRDQIDAALGKIYKDLGSQVQKTAGEEIVDRLRAWRYLSMLGNPRTHVRNFVGNAIFVPAVELKNAIGATLESTLRVKERTKSLTVTQAAKQFAAQDAEAMEATLKGEADKSIRDLIMDERKTFSFGKLNDASDFNSKWLEKEDWIFLKYHYQRALAQYLSANGFNSGGVDPSMLSRARQYAVREAQKATYRDANRLSDWLNQSKGAGPVVKYLMEGMVPFKKTPANILKRGIEYSPAMLVERLTKGIYDLNTGKMTVNEYIDGLASGLTGTAICALGFFLASTGAILGGYRDDDDKKERKLKGLQEYSVRIGNHTYTIDWAAPASLPLFIGVEAMNALREDHELNLSDLSKAAGRLIDPMINMSMLSGLNDTLEAISYSDDKLSTIVTETFLNLLGQYVPTILGQAARTADLTQRINYQDKNTKIPKNLLYFAEKMQNKIPFLSFTNDPYLNEFGQENRTESRFLAAIQNFISPGYIARVTDDRVIGEVSRVNAEQDDDALPSKMPKYFGKGDERIDLTSAQYTLFQRTAGTVAYNIIDSMIDDERYDGLSAESQAQAIKMAYDYAKAAGRTEVQPEWTSSDKWIREAMAEAKDGTQVKDIILDRTFANIIKSEAASDKKEDKLDAIINNKTMSVKDKAAAYAALYPDDKKFKEWSANSWSAVDYMTYTKKLGSFSGDDKQEKVIRYIKSATSNTRKQKLMWQMAGYKESTFSKNFE